jgi:Ca-activated chloride channel family protein
VDEAMILSIASETRIVAPLTTDRTAQRAAIDGLEVWGSTRLFDAIVLALDTIASARGRRALVLLTDGDERDSTTTQAQVLAKARQTGVLVYPVILARALPDVFRWLAGVTGARAFTAPARDVDAAVRAVVGELRHQYLIGYSPRRPLTDAPGRWRRVTVSTRRGDLQLRTREGYYP